MGIEDQNGNEIVRLGTVHAIAFKALIWMGMIATPAAFALFWRHSESIKLHEWRITALERAGGRAGSVSQSVNVGEAGQAAAGDEAESGRAWLTTSEVAHRESKSERTIINYIEENLISPAPAKNGKSWMIAEDYRLLPKVAGNGGND